MFDAIQNIKFGYVLCGVIWAMAMGFAAGNYACSLVHRLPRGRLILDKKPYCGSCGEQLQVRDLFPVVSALLLRHRCRYCGTPYPVSHTWTEILVGLLFVLTFLEYGFGERFLLIAFIGIFLITLAAIEANEGMVMGRILLCIIVPGMIFRTLQDATIYNLFQGGLYGLLIGAVIWRKKIEPVGHVFRLPTPALLLAVGGICTGGKALLPFLALFAVFYAADWLVRKISSPSPLEGEGRDGGWESHAQSSTTPHPPTPSGFGGSSPNPPHKNQILGGREPLITVAFGLATILTVMYPKLITGIGPGLFL